MHLNNVWQESLSGSTRTPHFLVCEYFFHNWMRVKVILCKAITLRHLAEYIKSAKECDIKQYKIVASISQILQLLWDCQVLLPVKWMNKRRDTRQGQWPSGSQVQLIWVVYCEMHHVHQPVKKLHSQEDWLIQLFTIMSGNFLSKFPQVHWLSWQAFGNRLDWQEFLFRV